MWIKSRTCYFVGFLLFSGYLIYEFWSDYLYEGAFNSPFYRLKRQLPNCIIIGVQKGGTAALLKFLGEYPEVKIAKYEVHFFDKMENYAKGLDWYRKQMPKALSTDIVIEKTPAYFHTKGVSEKIYNFNPNIRLILLIRDPFNRTISSYLQLQKKHGVGYPRFDEIIFLPNTTILNEHYGPIKLSCYCNFIEPWLNYFPRKNILILKSEELLNDPSTILTKVESFLGLSSYASPRMFYFHPTRNVPCLRAPVRMKNKNGCLRRTKGRKPPTVDPATKNLLNEYFLPCYNRFLNAI